MDRLCTNCVHGRAWSGHGGGAVCRYPRAQVPALLRRGRSGIGEKEAAKHCDLYEPRPTTEEEK